MIRLIIILSCLASQAIVSLMFLRYKNQRQLIRKRFSGIPDKTIGAASVHGRVIAVTGYGKRRMAVITTIGVVLIVFFLSIAAAATFMATSGQDNLATSVFMALTLSLISILPWSLMMEAHGRFCIVTNAGIECYLPFRKNRYVTWNQVKCVWWLPLFGGFRIHTECGPVAASSVWENIQILAEGILHNVPKSRLKWAEKPLKKALDGPFEPASLI